MNIDEFMTAIENIYGKYENEFMFAVVLSFVKENFREEEYEGLFKRIVTRFSTDFKKALDVAKISQIMIDDAKIKADRIWQGLLTKSVVPDTLIIDPYAFQVVSGYGSWARFCAERDRNREWTHKAFISRYVEYLIAGNPVTPKKLMGAISEEYTGGGQNEVQIIGDQTAGRKLLAESNGPEKIKELLSFVKSE